MRSFPAFPYQIVAQVLKQRECSHCRFRPAHAFFLTLIFLAGSFFAAGISLAENGAAPAGQLTVQAARDPSALWLEAESAATAGDKDKASRLYQEYYEEFRASEKSEEALWRSARTAKSLAEESTEPEWERVRNLFRMYSTDFAQSARAPEAYFELGLSHYHMRFYREALIYFKLFAERYPNSPFLDQVKFWQGQTLLRVGRTEEAAEVFMRLEASATEPEIKARAALGIGDWLYSEQKFSEALDRYQRFMQDFPSWFLTHPEILRELGKVYQQLGNEEESRKHFFRYLNLTENMTEKLEVMFALGDSYYRQGDDNSALVLFRRIEEEGTSGSRAVVLSRFRLAEYADDPDRKLAKWQRRGDMTDKEGDKPFRDVMDNYGAEPIAQDVRRALFARYLARNDFESAYDIGRGFLRNDKPGVQSGEKGDYAGRILVSLAEGLLARKEYEKLYQLYSVEHRHVNTLNSGRFLYLVGQALEAMSLHEQASVVYYRALALPLEPQDKANLYFRRAEVYLALKDHAAADRLLVYLREIYANVKELGEVSYLSGRLSEARGRKVDALAYYDKAIALMTFPDKRSDYLDSRLRMLFALGSLDEALSSVKKYAKDQWLSQAAVQDWCKRLGDAAFRQKKDQQAMAAYLGGVAADMPQETQSAQQMHLRLGELFLKGQEVEKSRFHYEKAQAGPDSILGKKAKERLNQIDINKGRRRGTGA